MPFKEDGFELIDKFISFDQLEKIKKEMKHIECNGGGVRNAEKKLYSVSELISDKKYLDIASSFLPGEAKFVRAIMFLKSMENNWLVAWHQDKTVAISQKLDNVSWGPWSKKDGVLHAQVPNDVLDEIVSFRVHIDDSAKENGCLRVIPRSHQEGVMSQESIYQYTRSHNAVHCDAAAGSALVMRPHILHASSKSNSAKPRRVLHIEFSSYQLPKGVEWA
jgi:hypothetical protein